MVYNYTKRAIIFIGTVCNVRCRFCYYYFTGMKDRRSIWDIKKQMHIVKRTGMEAIDFSGGEPTMLDELAELISYARQLGFKTIGMLTNGLKTYKKEYLQKLVDCGLNNILFSVHGHNAEEHDYTTQAKGSFSMVIKSIENVQEIGMPFRINCTITKINYKNLEKHAELYNQLKPIQVNFILFNDFETAFAFADKFLVRYSDSSSYIKRAIDIMKEKIPYINVRYIPFCFMKDYEKYVCCYPQKIYDPFEWSQRLLARLNSKEILPIWKYYAHLGFWFIRYHPPLKINFKEYLEDICITCRMKTYVKPEKCEGCKFYHICEGLEKSYVDMFDTSELKPANGEKIKDPIVYRRGFYAGRL